MLSKINSYLTRIFKNIKKQKKEWTLKKEREDYINNGLIPWSKGYYAYKTEVISKNINDSSLIELINKNEVPKGFGYRLDERVIEYPWVFSKLKNKKTIFLDAGSTFNFDYLLNTKIIEKKEKYIYTFYPEKVSYNYKKVSYIYGDLRNLPFKDNFFEEIVCQSTIEHIDMDNSIYGYDHKHKKDYSNKSYEYLIAIKEMIRVLKSNGLLLLTFPFGKFENHEFFQQFDSEMLDRIIILFANIGIYKIDFFKYEKEGWRFANRDELKDVISYNPHSAKGKQDDGAAHCRSVACIHFTKH
jgi:SAM-dependent methyltransferase